MKKNKIVFLIIFLYFLLFGFETNVFAKTNISIKVSSSTVQIGDIITATFTISSDKVLGSWKYKFNYDSSKLILLDNANEVIGGANFDRTSKSSSTKVRFKAKEKGTTKIYIEKDELDITNLEQEDEVPNTTLSSKTITIKEKYVPPVVTYSKNNYLSSLEIEGYSLEPKFDKNTLEYTVKLPKETYNIKLNAKTEDKKATVNGIGDVTLIDGENKLEVKVAAENGNVKTYVIKAIVEEPNPIIVNIDGKEYTVVRKSEGINIPTNYRETKVDIQNESVLAFYGEITKYNLVALKDSDSNIGLYVYNLDDGSYQLYEELKFNSINIYPYSIPEDKILKGYERTKLTINGTEVDVLNNNSSFPIVYGMNLNNGEISYYTYDSKENTLQRYKEEFVFKLQKENKKFSYISIALGSFCILELIIMIIILVIINNKNNKKLEQTLEKTMRINSTEMAKNGMKSKKELKKENKVRIKEEKLRIKEEKKKQKNNENMDNL